MMDVFRVQTDQAANACIWTGVGPHRARMVTFELRDRLHEAMLGVWSNAANRPVHSHWYATTYDETGNDHWRSGFKNMYQLALWFPGQVLLDLFGVGFYVAHYRVPEKEVSDTDPFQIAFNSRYAYFVSAVQVAGDTRTMFPKLGKPVSHYLKRKGVLS